ncbi:hypothetical protein [Burkholderia sp. Ac-20365]|uniref:hypothetical protein n=1 Tax=Burkholderia sp. Ac-20365 TaxID=2703897 RepID=UPI00197B1FD6|nr:hypothetical protein [Burkholderia sp. Ac-20365]MBN3761365.1 hypothetical protein [Burkholderia sp. Ac-20365]
MRLSARSAVALLLLSAAATANAGQFNWHLTNHAVGYGDDELKAVIADGISSSSENASLGKDYTLNILVSGGSGNDRAAAPGMIVVQKIKPLQYGEVVYCSKYDFGTYTRAQLAEKLRDVMRVMPSYSVSSPDCRTS